MSMKSASAKGGEMGEAVPGVEIRGGGSSAHSGPHARNLGGGSGSSAEYGFDREFAEGSQDPQRRQQRRRRVQVCKEEGALFFSLHMIKH